jgi:hypothetical protein
MLDVVCVLRPGGKVQYDTTWVTKLRCAVERNLHMPYRFSCITDADVDCDRIDLDPGHHGFWNKLQLFKPGRFTGATLYLDLDTVICSDITPMIRCVQNQSFVMWYESDKQIHSSAMMYWQGDHSYLWHLYCSQTWHQWHLKYNAEPLYGDQALISEHTQHSLWIDHCPLEWFAIAGVRDKRQKLEDVRILLFRKPSLKPSTMPHHPLVQAHWH